jgi:hypothetical protein
MALRRYALRAVQIVDSGPFGGKMDDEGDRSKSDTRWDDGLCLECGSALGLNDLWDICNACALEDSEAGETER